MGPRRGRVLLICNVTIKTKIAYWCIPSSLSFKTVVIYSSLNTYIFFWSVLHAFWKGFQWQLFCVAFRMYWKCLLDTYLILDNFKNSAQKWEPVCLVLSNQKRVGIKAMPIDYQLENFSERLLPNNWILCIFSVQSFIATSLKNIHYPRKKQVNGIDANHINKKVCT